MAAITVPQTDDLNDRWLKRQTFISSQFWRLEVQDNDVGSETAYKWLFPHVDGALHMVFSLCVHVFSVSVCLSLCPDFLLLENHQSYGIRAHPKDPILI